MKILIVAATTFEIEPLLSQLRQADTLGKIPSSIYYWAGLEIEILITGVGLTSTAWNLGQHLAHRTYDLLLQVGIAGALDRELELAEVVEVVSETFADLGVEEADGSFTDIMSMGFTDPDSYPYKQGRLWNQADIKRSFLPTVHGISVNKVHGHEPSINSLVHQYPYAQIETMEGAAFFLAALQIRLPFIQIRAISNYVESRQRDKWKIKESITKLNEVLLELLSTLATSATNPK
jgi:futalosine hydrolase